MSKWLVNGLIPVGHTVLLLGQPQSLKSWLDEELAVCVAAGKRFLGSEGFAVQKGSVILIDEDTPTDTLEERLTRLCSGFDVDLASIPLDVRSMQGFSLNDDKQIKALKNDIGHMNPPILIIVDSLSSVMGQWNENTSSDATKVALRWNELKARGATLLIIHHMSLKKPGSYRDFDFTGLAMGSTYLIAKCDTAIGLWRIPPEKPTRFVLKPKPRRQKLLVNNPFGVQLLEPDDGSWAQLTLLDELPAQPSELAKRIFPLFYSDNVSEVTVQQVIDMVGKDAAESDVREALHELEAEQVLIRDVGQGRAHRFQYKLNPDFVNQYVATTSYWDELIS